MAKTPYDTDLDRRAANFQPLTPLTFLERAAAVFPDHTAIIHGAPALDLREFLRARTALASALAEARHRARRHGRRSMLANTPADARGSLRRPDDRRRAQRDQHPARRRRRSPSSLDHAETKVLIVDREFAHVIKEALARGKVKPLVIDYDDPEFAGAGERLGAIEYEAVSSPRATRSFDWALPGRRMGRDLAQLHVGHDRRPQGRRLPSSRRLSARVAATS